MSRMGFANVCIQEDKRVAAGPADSGEWNLRGRLRAASKAFLA